MTFSCPIFYVLLLSSKPACLFFSGLSNFSKDLFVKQGGGGGHNEDLICNCLRQIQTLRGKHYYLWYVGNKMLGIKYDGAVWGPKHFLLNRTYESNLSALSLSYFPITANKLERCRYYPLKKERKISPNLTVQWRHNFWPLRSRVNFTNQICIRQRRKRQGRRCHSVWIKFLHKF